MPAAVGFSISRTDRHGFGRRYSCALDDRLICETSSRLQGLNVFVVEDEALVALNLEDMLADLGCRVVGSALRVGAAHEMLEQALMADVAILDVNVAGEPIFPLAQQLATRGIPIIFATGYGQSGIPDAWADAMILQKPYTMQDVSGSLMKATRAG